MENKIKKYSKFRSYNFLKNITFLFFLWLLLDCTQLPYSLLRTEKQPKNHTFLYSRRNKTHFQNPVQLKLHLHFHSWLPNKPFSCASK